MKAYNEYMDNISVSDALHRRLVSCAAHTRPARRPQTVRRYVAAFACLAVIMLGVLSIPRLFSNNVTPIADSSQQPRATNPTVTKPGSSEKLNDTLSSANIVDGSGYEQTHASYRVPASGTCQFITPVSNAMKDYAGTDAMLFVAINIISGNEHLADGSEKQQKEIQRLMDLGYQVRYCEAWTYKGKGEQVPYTFLGGLFTVAELENFPANANYGYSFYFPHNGDGSAVKVDTSVFESPGSDLDLTAAYADPDFGAYLPEDLPAGFAFETAHRSANQESNSLFSSWHKGLGYIEWRVSPFEEDDKARLTSVTDTQNYDLSLYPIPRADSVPRELRIIVNNPIFRIEDLTLEVVQARSYEVSDAGDEPGSRMHFSVLYGDVLVELNVKGATLEDVFEMLQQIKK